jgi:iron complex outermembrane recepter protein
MPHGSSSKIRSVAVTGSLEDCFALVQGVSGGNPDLQPETSTQWNFGVVWEPLRELSLGLDYWNIEQRGVISPLEPDNILRFPERFGSRLIRGPVDPATPNLPGPIVAIDTSLINLGTTKTSGVDVSLAWTLPFAVYGNFRLGLQGTYVREWKAQIDGVTYVSLLGNALYGPPVPRWRSALTVDWTCASWGATLAHLYIDGYVDQNPGVDRQLRDVGAFATWDLQGRYSGFTGWLLAAGIRNLFDREPPFSNQGDTFQVGFNPQAANPLGRVFYLRARYAFR